jgi:hypothetical protein
MDDDTALAHETFLPGRQRGEELVAEVTFISVTRAQRS